MRYEVRALSAANNIETLTIDAADGADARRQAEALNLKPLSVRDADARSRGRGANRFSLMLFSQELLALLEAGLNLLEGLEALREKEVSAGARALLDRLLAELRQGKRFSAALAAQPHIFPSLYVGIVKSSEGTGDLPRALRRYIDYRARAESVRGKLISASIYPSILFVVGGAVTLFLLGYVVPRFASVYQGTGRPLPWLTEVLLGWGRTLSTHGTLAATLFLATLAIAAFFLHRIVKRGHGWRLVRRLPGIGAHLEIIELSRLYLTLGMLLEGGIPIVTALDMAAAAVSAEAAGRLASARQAIVGGQSLSTSFEATGFATPIALRMIRVGERSGQLGTMLTRAALFYEGEVERWLERFSRTFEPLLMAAIGVIVGLIVVLLYMPIFDLAGSLT